MQHALRIEDYTVPVRLGCGEPEREVPQEVRFTVEVRFDAAPPGAVSDRIEETVCYADLCDALKRLCQDREFRLIERLALQAYQVVRELVSSADQVALRIHKVRPPIENLRGGSQYRIGDFLL